MRTTIRLVAGSLSLMTGLAAGALQPSSYLRRHTAHDDTVYFIGSILNSADEYIAVITGARN